MNGILLRVENAAVRQGAKQRRLGVVLGEPSLPFEKTLIVGPGLAVPWQLIDAGWRALDRWEVAAPLSPTLAEDAKGDREGTRAIVRDLRVPTYEIDLILLRRCEATERLIDVWTEHGGDSLAFLRALYLVKPLLLALPRSWTRDVYRVEPKPTRTGVMTKLIHVEIAPGRFVCCRPEEADRYREQFQVQLSTKRVTSARQQ